MRRLYMPAPDLSVGPKALLEFKESKAPAEWGYDTGSIIEWFAAKFAVKKDKIHISNKTTGISPYLPDRSRREASSLTIKRNPS